MNSVGIRTSCEKQPGHVATIFTRDDEQWSFASNPASLIRVAAMFENEAEDLEMSRPDRLMNRTSRVETAFEEGLEAIRIHAFDRFRDGCRGNVLGGLGGDALEECRERRSDLSERRNVRLRALVVDEKDCATPEARQPEAKVVAARVSADERDSDEGTIEAVPWNTSSSR